MKKSKFSSSLFEKLEKYIIPNQFFIRGGECNTCMSATQKEDQTYTTGGSSISGDDNSICVTQGNGTTDEAQDRCIAQFGGGPKIPKDLLIEFKQSGYDKLNYNEIITTF